MTRVLHATRGPDLSERTGSGGLERVLDGLVQAQRAAGHCVEIASVSASILEEATALAQVRDWVRLSALGNKLIGQGEYDLLHCHDWYAAPIAEAFRERGMRPCVLTSHLPLRRGFTYWDSSVSWDAKTALESRLFDLASLVVAPSKFVAKFLQSEYGTPQSRLSIIGHGVDLNDFVISNINDNAREHQVLLAVGRLTEQKGFELAIRAFHHLANELPTLRLIIIGNGQRRGSLLRLADYLGISTKVVIAPAVPTAHLCQIFGQVDLVLMPSLFEPFGLVALESLACGTPVLAIAPTGASDFLLDGEVVDTTSPRRLATEISRRLIETRSGDCDRKALRERAAQHTWHLSAMKYERLYQKLINSGSIDV